MQKRQHRLRDLDLLLGDLCRKWGFCNHLTANELVPAGKALTNTEFAYTVLRAEKMNPDYEPTWTQRICEKFSARFGPSFTLMD
jgi:hypothetical protein